MLDIDVNLQQQSQGRAESFLRIVLSVILVLLESSLLHASAWKVISTVPLIPKRIQFVDTLHGWCFGTDSIRRTSDGGYTWSSLPYLQQTGKNPNQYSFVNETTGLAFGGNELFQTIDAGKNWGLIYLDSHSDIMQICTRDTGWLYIMDWEGCIRSHDGGQSWTSIGIDPWGNTIDVLDSSHIVTASLIPSDGPFNPIFIYTMDGGFHWKNWSGGETIQLAFVDSASIIALTETSPGEYSIWMTTDGGTHWENPVQYSSATSFGYSSRTDIRTFGEEYNQIKHTTDEGATWEIEFEAQEMIENGQVLDAHHGWACGQQGSIIAMTSGAEGVRERESNLSFHLSQNYPNPFNPTTNFGYRIADIGFVTLTVFNILGQEVARPVNGIKAPGTYEVPWDAGRLASGVYFYRLDATSISDPTKHFSQTRKMLFAK